MKQTILVRQSGRLVEQQYLGEGDRLPRPTPPNTLEKENLIEKSSTDLPSTASSYVGRTSSEETSKQTTADKSDITRQMLAWEVHYGYSHLGMASVCT